MCVEKDNVAIRVINVWCSDAKFTDSMILGYFVVKRKRHQTYLSLFYVEIEMLNNIEIVYI